MPNKKCVAMSKIYCVYLCNYTSDHALQDILEVPGHLNYVYKQSLKSLIKTVLVQTIHRVDEHLETGNLGWRNKFGHHLTANVGKSFMIWDLAKGIWQ